MRFLLSVLLSILLNGYLFSQASISKKGSFYAYWGWNRAAYSPSDIYFRGADYDFVLKDVNAMLLH